MSTTSFPTSPRPPTSNSLDPRQRTRLIRTTRKLGAVLGTTPHLLEQHSPAPSPPLLPIAGRTSPLRKTSAYAKRRQGSVFELPPPTAAALYDSSSDASSSVSSLSLSRSSLDSTTSLESTASLPPPKSFSRHVRDKSRSKGKQAPLPTPLVLRLNAVPLPPSDPRLLQPVTPDTSATLTFAQTASYSRSGNMLPTTPTTPITPTATETRRKRLAKLKRTLGENVPTELVLPFRSATPARATKQPSASPFTPPSAPTTPRARLAPPTTPRARPAPPTTPRARPAPPTTPRARPAPQTTLPRPPPSRQPAHRRRSMSVDFGQTASPLPTPSPAPVLSPQPERRSSRVWIIGNGTWTGEWNRKDIREVQHQLRALRVR